jgi:hypothetical protein
VECGKRGAINFLSAATITSKPFSIGSEPNRLDQMYRGLANLTLVCVDTDSRLTFGRPADQYIIAKSFKKFQGRRYFIVSDVNSRIDNNSEF